VRKIHALAGSVLFFAIAPGTVGGYLPWLITGWRMKAPFMHQEWSRAVGIVLVLAGLVPLVDSFRRFVVEGLGTPAPVAPPGHLVVTGFYRRVRNPMYVALLAIILGQALLFADRNLLWYGGVIWLAFHLFVVGYEEPALRRSFGEQYEAFRDNVPRWIPRLRGWRGSM
jgi:protein-S-isoprenylcysteine O-methyltransferase Ste14